MSLSTVTDLGWHVGVLLPIAGRMCEESAALETFGRGMREGDRERLGVIPKLAWLWVLPVQLGLTKFNEDHMMYTYERTNSDVGAKDHVVKKHKVS